MCSMQWMERSLRTYEITDTANVERNGTVNENNVILSCVMHLRASPHINNIALQVLRVYSPDACAMNAATDQ